MKVPINLLLLYTFNLSPTTRTTADKRARVYVRIYIYIYITCVYTGWKKEHRQLSGTFVRKRLGSAQWEAKLQ